MDEGERMRDYKDEYEKFQSSPSDIKKRTELNRENHQRGTYGNNDNLDVSHINGGVKLEPESINRGRKEKSRMKGSKRKLKNGGTPSENVPKVASEMLRKKAAKKIGMKPEIIFKEGIRDVHDKLVETPEGDKTKYYKETYGQKRKGKKKEARKETIEERVERLTEEHSKPAPLTRGQKILKAFGKGLETNPFTGPTIKAVKHIKKSYDEGTPIFDEGGIPKDDSRYWSGTEAHMQKTATKKDVEETAKDIIEGKGETGYGLDQIIDITQTAKKHKRKLENGGNIKKYAKGDKVDKHAKLRTMVEDSLKGKDFPYTMKIGHRDRTFSTQDEYVNFMARQTGGIGIEELYAGVEDKKGDEVGGPTFKEGLRDIHGKLIENPDGTRTEYSKETYGDEKKKYTFKEGIRDIHGELIETPEGEETEYYKKTYGDKEEDLTFSQAFNKARNKDKVKEFTWNDKKFSTRKKGEGENWVKGKGWTEGEKDVEEVEKFDEPEGTSGETKKEYAARRKKIIEGWKPRELKPRDVKYEYESEDVLDEPFVADDKGKSRFKTPRQAIENLDETLTELKKRKKEKKKKPTTGLFSKVKKVKVPKVREVSKQKLDSARAKLWKNRLKSDEGALAWKAFEKSPRKDKLKLLTKTMQDGGMLIGPSHKQGGIAANVGNQPIEMEGGEYVIKKESAKKLGEDLLHYMNKTGKVPKFLAGGYAKKLYQDGGMTPEKASEMDKLGDNRTGLTPVYEQGGQVTISTETYEGGGTVCAGDIAHTSTHSNYKAGE